MLCQSMIRKSGCSVEQVWVMNDFVETEPVDSFLDFVKKGRSHHQATKFSRLIGDATHEKTSHGVEKIGAWRCGNPFS